MTAQKQDYMECMRDYNVLHVHNRQSNGSPRTFIIYVQELNPRLSNLTRGDVKRAVAVIHRAAVTVGVKLNDTAGVLADRDTDEGSVGLALTTAEDVAISILDLARLRVASEVSLAVEGAWGGPAVTLDSELAAVTGVVAGRVVVRGTVIVDGIAVVVDDGETAVVAVGVTASRAGDGGEVTGREDDLEVLGGDGGRGCRQEEEDGVADSGHGVEYLWLGLVWFGWESMPWC